MWHSCYISLKETNRKNKKEKGSEHYSTLEIEPFEIIEKDFTLEEQRGYYKGNILKYTLRDKKQNQEDAVKIQVYAEKLQDLKRKVKVDKIVDTLDKTKKKIDEVCLLEDLVKFLEESIQNRREIIETTDNGQMREFHQYFNAGMSTALSKVKELKKEYVELDDKSKRSYGVRKE